jgi:hypothetical protein
MMNRGIALVAAILISLAVMCLIIATIYFLIVSTGIAGAGKRYATASEAADGAVEVMKDAVNLMMTGEPASSLPLIDNDPPCLSDSVIEGKLSCTVNLSLPGPGLNDYKATITVVRLYASDLPGSSMDFLNKKGSAVFYRINTVVAGPGSTRAETTALYRYVY